MTTLDRALRQRMADRAQPGERERIAVAIEEIDVHQVLARATSTVDAVALMRTLATEAARAGGAAL